ncbi:Karyopherin transporter [Balamuthia mandrillaris]
MAAEEFEKAVLISVNPTGNNAAVVQQAEAYLQSVRTSDMGWRFCCEQFFASSVVEVKFVCVQVIVDVLLHRYESLSQEDRAFLRETLLKWLRDYLPEHPDEPASVKNKFAQALALLFKLEYLREWPSFFQDLFGLLQKGPSVLDVFLRLIRAIDQHVVSSDVVRSTAELAHNTALKDRMRDDCVATLTEVWYNLLLAYQDSYPQLAKSCLKAMKNYIAWIDIQLIVNERFVPLFFSFLEKEALRADACECIYEVVTKGMPPLTKMELLNKLNLFHVLSSVKNPDEEFLQKEAKILNSVGLELLSGWSKLQELIAEKAMPPEMEAKGIEMVETALNVLWEFLAHPNFRISALVFPFITAYVTKLKQEKDLSEHRVQQLEKLLSIVARKMAYDENFDFEKEEEYEEEFNRYRQELAIIFRKVIPIAPELVASFVHSLVVRTLSNLSSIPFQEVEVALTLLYNLGDGLTGLPENIRTAFTHFFSQIMPTVVTSNVSDHPHKAVVLVYFENVVRYARFLSAESAHTQAILTAFLGKSGLRHSDPAVRRQAAHLFARFVRVKKEQFAPFLEDIIKNVQDLLLISEEAQRFLVPEAQTNLYDAVGVLIGSAPEEQQAAFLELLLAPLIRQSKEIISQQLFKNDTPERPTYTNILQHIVQLMGTLSKGFVGCSGDKAAYWKKALESVLEIAEALPNSVELQSKIMFFLHLMVEVLRVEMFPYIPAAVQHLLEHAAPNLLSEFIRLICQFVNRFKTAVGEVLDVVLQPLVAKVFEAARQPVGPKSEEEREQNELQKTYFQLIQGIASNNLAPILTSSRNAPMLQQILESLLQGATSPDLAAKKLCFSTLRFLMQSWGNSGEETMKGYAGFVCDNVIPLSFQLLLQPTWNLEDALSNQVLTEMAHIQKALQATCPDMIAGCLASKVLPGLGCNQEAIQFYVQNLQQTDKKQFPQFLKHFVASLRKS